MEDFFRTLSALETVDSIDSLMETMSRLIGNFGFSRFTYVDLWNHSPDKNNTPFFRTTLEQNFVTGYNKENFFSYDPILRQAGITNRPFAWTGCPEFKKAMHQRGSKTKTRKIMEFAHDFGFQDGYIIPVHAVNMNGRKVSALLSFYYAEGIIVEDKKAHFAYGLRMAALLFHEKMLELRKVDSKDPLNIELTDREKDCLLWACRGKTSGETADILSISQRTVEFHFENIIRKLRVNNKIHAISFSVSHGLITP
ncbi:MAG: LuxR family transcriptional regulator [Pseudomonadota bacterium]|nr:LuxR family transcriptional regulator [Pseudomonadota bacterium]